MNLNKQKREALKQKFGGRCAYCGVQLGDKWHADHVMAVNREMKYVRNPETHRTRMVCTGKLYRPENDCIDNLVPSCPPCNIDKSVLSLEDWRDWLQNRMIESMQKNWPNFRHALRFGRVQIVDEPLVFWFEKYALRSAATHS